MPALQGREWRDRAYVFSEQAGGVAMTGASLITMVRDNDWKAVFIHGADDGQLFDLQRDPKEERNLWFDPASEPARDRPKAAMFEWRQASMLQTMDLHADHR